MIAYIERLRDDKLMELAETQIESLFAAICDKAVDMPTANEYEFSLNSVDIVEKHQEHVLAKVKDRLANEDVVATLQYDAFTRHLMVRLDSFPTPTNEVNSVKYYWSREPGKFVNKLTGDPISLASSLSIGPSFTGTVREWYETLIETVIDVSNAMRKTGVKPTKVFVPKDVHTILECSVLYRPNLKMSALYDGMLCSWFKVFALERHNGDSIASSTRNIIRVIADVGDTRHVGFVEVLDMPII